MTVMQGLFSDNLPAKVVTLTNRAGMSVSFTDIGATWLSCKLPVIINNELTHREVLLGTNNMDDHQKQTAYMGSTIGRFANRICKGQFSLNGEHYQLSINNGKHCLHGGSIGFSHRRWQLEHVSDQQVRFSLLSTDGDQGFPGNLNVSVEYQLTDDNQVRIQYVATTDKATPVNLTNHAYFNLMGSEAGYDCLGHSLQLAAKQYLAVDADLIPTGECKAVTHTHFDFQRQKVIGLGFMTEEDHCLASGLDHAFVLNDDCENGKQPAAKLKSLDGLVTLEMTTTKPAVHVYTGNFLQGNPSRRQNESYKNFSGIALESEFFPDSPNQDGFPNCILEKESRYQHQTCYRFLF